MQKFLGKVESKIKDQPFFKGQPESPAGSSSARPPPQHGPTPVYPQQGQQPPGPGKMPPKPANVRYMGAMRFYHPRGHQHNVMRDLGFTGIIDGRIVWSWGDTLMGTEDQSMICATDSTSIGNMNDPMGACDTDLAPGTDNVANWIPPNREEEADGGLSCYAFGGTNIIEYAPNKGLVYYLKNHRPGGNSTIKGAGVATVEIDQHNIPHATRIGEKLWNDFEPAWGDVGVAYNSQDGHVYAYGHGPSHDKELCVRTYLCKAPAHEATDVGKYEYWDNSKKEWTRTRLANGHMGTAKVEKEHAVFDWMVMNQAAPFWSNYFNKWMFLHGNCFGFSDVLCRTADKLEGPWHDHGVVASTLPDGKGEGFRYCATGHPEFDATGKTVLVTWTRNNIIYGSVIEWE